MKYKYVILLVSLIIQTCLGGIYAWSKFVKPLTETYPISNAQSQIIFGVNIAVFTVAMIFAGRLLNKYGPRLIAAAGGLLFGLGYFYASFSDGDFFHIFAGIGIFNGIGIGMGYVCPLTTCIKWFPKHKGLITGISVASFGTGAIALSLISGRYLNAGVDVLVVFRWMAIIYAALILSSAMFMKFPQIPETSGQSLQIKDMLKSRSFWVLFTGMFCGTFSGLMVIGNLEPIGLNFGIDQLKATLAISAFAIGNGAGRITWGYILDKNGKTTIAVSLFALAFAVIALLAVSGINLLFIFTAFLIGFGFGACFVLYAAYIGIIYGGNAVASIYPWVFLAYGISGIIGPFVGGFLFEKTGSFTTPIIVASIVAFTGGTVLLADSKNNKTASV